MHMLTHTCKKSDAVCEGGPELRIGHSGEHTIPGPSLEYRSDLFCYFVENVSGNGL